MLKKFVLILMCVLPLAGFAQTLKFGNVNSAEIFEAMPEKATIQKELDALNAQYEKDLTKLHDEYQRKVSDFVAQQDSLPETIRTRRAQEINDIEQRIQNFRQVAYQDIQQAQNTKLQPVFEKISKAIKEVGEENGFTYIFDLSNSGIVYYSPTNTVDVAPMVKAKLGIK
ncbi:MAG: OmpH family outer membrane protein [Bacteroidales bacterium]|nr:OmpH family outer membrane protein [Bacteroidales bacterium]